jgi:hypothetical protein
VTSLLSFREEEMRQGLLDVVLIVKQAQLELMKPERMMFEVQRIEHPLYGCVRQCRFREPMQD